MSHRNTPPEGRRKFATTVTLEPDVYAFLESLQREYDRDRSYLLNALVKDYQRRHITQSPKSTGAQESILRRPLSA